MGLEGVGFVGKAGDAGVSGCLPGPGPIPNLGMQPDPRRRSRHSRAEKNFLAGGAGQKMDLSLFRRLRPAEVCDAALPGESMGRGRWGGPYGVEPAGLLRRMGRCGRLRGVPCRARGVGRRRWGEPYGANPDGLLRWMGRCGKVVTCALPGNTGAPQRPRPRQGGIGWARNPPTDSVHWSPAPPAGRTGFPGGSAPPRPGRSGGPPIPPPATAPGRTGAAPPPGGRRAG